jgi:hypothetical protein
LSATEQVEDFCPVIPQTLIELLMEKEYGVLKKISEEEEEEEFRRRRERSSGFIPLHCGCIHPIIPQTLTELMMKQEAQKKLGLLKKTSEERKEQVSGQRRRMRRR